MAEIPEKITYITDKSIKRKSFPSIRFYYNLVKIIYYSNKLVKEGKYDSAAWKKSSEDIKNALENVGVKIEAKGLENISKTDSPVIFISNHMSSLETMVFPILIQPIKKFVFIMKEELVKFPLFGPVTGARYPILVGRKNPKEDLLKVFSDGKERIKDGRSILVFPQKTRSEYLEEKSFNSLGIKLAKKNNCPVIPIAILTNAWSKGSIIKDFGKIYPEKQVLMEFGEPINIEKGNQEEHKKVVDFIKSKFIDWGREDLIRE